MILLVLAVLLGAAPAGAAVSGSPARARAEYLRGTLLERRGAYPEALAAFEKALELDPSSAFLAGEAAELAVDAEDWARAEKWSRRRLELAPKDAKSHMTLARVLWARGDLAGAELAYGEAARLDPSSADSIFALVELVGARDTERARRILERFLKADPERAYQTLRELGRLDAQDGRYARAVETLKRAIELDAGESGPARLILAEVYEVTRDTRAAIAEYRRLSADEPEDLDLAAHLGELEALAGDAPAARATFRRVKDRRPDQPAACAWLASDAEREGDFAGAARFLKDSAALKDDPILHLRLGYYQLQAGGVQDAVRTLEAARRRWPKDDRVAYYLALGRDDLGDRSGAAALLREVLAVKPEDRDARWQLAAILEKTGDIAGSEAEFRRLLADNPGDAAALNYLGYALADRGLKLAQAEELVRGALELEPANAAFRDSLGWVLFKLGRSTQALSELSASARALPEDEAVWEHLGEVYRALGRDARAWRAFRLAQALGSAKAGGKADALRGNFSPEDLGELWRRHLDAVHGGLRRLTGVCELGGRIAGAAVSRRVLLSYRAPGELSFEVLGPLFSTAWRARVDGRGFFMDPLPVDGIEAGKVEEAVVGSLGAISSVLSGEVFAPGPARARRSWGRTVLERPLWRVRPEGALARVAVRAETGRGVTLSDFARIGIRSLPRRLEASGPFWDLAVTCPEPKAEFEPQTLPLEAP